MGAAEQGGWGGVGVGGTGGGAQGGGVCGPNGDDGGSGKKKPPAGRNFCIRGWGVTSVAVEKKFTSWGIFFFCPPPVSSDQNAIQHSVAKLTLAQIASRIWVGAQKPGKPKDHLMVALRKAGRMNSKITVEWKLPTHPPPPRGMQSSRAWCGTPPILGVVNIPLATTRRTHSTKFCRVFAFMIVLCFREVFEGARRNGTIRLAQFNHFRGEKHNCLLPLALSWCYACCVCCASCVFRSGASESASGSLPTRSTRSAGAKRFTPIIPPPIFFFCHAFTRVLCHTPALVPNGTETCVFH